jgi:single-stranded DNA-binding protein
MALTGIKGRVQTRTIEKEEEKPSHLTEMIAEKITFLSNKHGDDDVEKNENKDEE